MNLQTARRHKEKSLQHGGKELTFFIISVSSICMKLLALYGVQVLDYYYLRTINIIYPNYVR